MIFLFRRRRGTPPVSNPLSAITNRTNVLCNGDATGEAGVTASGGSAPYTYLWNTAATTSSITNLTAGTYTVTISDSAAQTVFRSITVTEPLALTSGFTQNNVLCNGGNSGNATMTPSGGATPYTYLWSGGGTSISKSGLIAGSHTCTITDANGCSIIKTVVITQPAVLGATPAQTNATCGLSNASASVTPTGGTGPFTFAWNTGASIYTITNVPAGSYNVLITDHNLCTLNVPFTITSDSSMAATTSKTDVLCNGQATGDAAIVTPSGGTAPYTYVWSTGATTQSITNLIAGSYSVTIKDANLCELVKNFTITQPTALTATQNSTNVSSPGGSNGTASVTPSGGTPSYSYAWNHGPTTSSVTGLVAGSYSVIITDSNSCPLTKNFTITEPSSSPGEFQYTIAGGGAQTSAGVYNTSTGVLQRTLWSWQSRAAGSYIGTWDGKNDVGATVAAGTYDVRIAYNNITKTWGVIGNTSTDLSGVNVIKFLASIDDMAISGTTMYCALGFSEASVNQFKMSTNNPQTKTDILRPVDGDANLEITHVCTDGTIVYWGGFDPFNSQKSFVFGTNVSNDAETSFSSGTSTNVIFGRTYPKALAIITNSSSNHITGMCVGSTHLYVARGSVNQIRVYNKTTGALVTTYTTTMAGLTLSNPRNLRTDGTTIWFLNGAGDIRTATISGATLIRSTNYDKTGLTSPLGLAINGSELTVIHGGALQYLRGYTAGDNSTTVLWTLGQTGGYQTNSTVATDKFRFSGLSSVALVPWVAYEAGGDLWVADAGNWRYIHFDATRTYGEDFQAQKMNYQVSMDRNDPKRVFIDGREYEDNLGSGWLLKRNWEDGITADYRVGQNNERDTLKSCMTLSNGRTYAFINYIDPGVGETPELVELVNNGIIRYSGIRFDYRQKITIDANGDLFYIDQPSQDPFWADNIGRAGVVWRRRALTGFDGSNWPTWAAEATVATHPTIAATDPGYKAGPFTPGQTTSGKCIVYSNHKDNQGFHLGAVSPGTSTYLWKTSPSTSPSYTGPFPTDGTFDTGNSVEYAGGDLLVVGNYILWNYIGEFYKNNQVNKFNMYNEHGLMLTQFGVVGADFEGIDVWAAAEMTGNSFSLAGVMRGSDLILYECDESWHSAASRWTISNLSSIGEILTTVIRP